MNKRIISYLNLSRFLIIGLIISQITTFCIIGHLIEEKQNQELNERICIEELIPLEPIKELN
jgi:hypothetical protein